MNENTNIPIAKKIRTGAGKGDANRVSNRAAFFQNYDAIDWSRKLEDGTIESCECHAEKVYCAGEWLCLNPACSYLNYYHDQVK